MKYCDVSSKCYQNKYFIFLPGKCLPCWNLVVSACLLSFHKLFSNRNTLIRHVDCLNANLGDQGAVSRDPTKKSRAKSGQISRDFFVASWLTAHGSRSTKYLVYRNVCLVNRKCNSSPLLIRRPSAAAWFLKELGRSYNVLDISLDLRACIDLRNGLHQSSESCHFVSIKQN